MLSSSVRVRSSLPQIFTAISTGQLEPYYELRYTPWIQWAKNGEAELLGRVPYLRSKNLSANVFHLYIHSPEAEAATLTVAAEPTGMNKMRGLLYGVGCLFCVVGILFPYLGFRLQDQRVRSILADLSQAITRWEEAHAAGGA